MCTSALKSKILNFVFLTKSANFGLKARNMKSLIDLVNNFDMDLAKVFYSYKYDSVFVHVAFFKQFWSSIPTKPNDIRKYEENLKKVKLLHKKLSPEDFKIQVLLQRYNINVISLITVDFIRYIKYCFKVSTFDYI